MADHYAAEDSGFVSRDCVTEFVRSILYRAVHIEKRFTVVQLEALSGVKARAIRSYMANDPLERREPSLSAALSLASVLGEDAVNAVLSLIRYGGARQLGEGEDSDSPLAMVACLMANLNEITQRAADGQFCGKDRESLRTVADQMIAKLVPLSSAGSA